MIRHKNEKENIGKWNLIGKLVEFSEISGQGKGEEKRRLSRERGS
jgi:competence protein ComGF